MKSLSGVGEGRWEERDACGGLSGFGEQGESLEEIVLV
jgi:hypothetical protein